MKLLILNGPNLNMLGIREPEIYGTLTYNGLVEYIQQNAQRLGVEVEFFQSNHEGALVDVIQNAYGRFDGIVINPAAYTHTSVAILDALKAVALPAAEVHLSDVTKREAFRQCSYAGMACGWHFIGEGKLGYVHAMEALIKNANQSLRQYSSARLRMNIGRKRKYDYQHKTRHTCRGIGKNYSCIRG